MGREASKVIATGASCVDHGGNAGPDATDVGVYTVGVDAEVNVSVQVDQSRGDDLTLNFEDPLGFFGGDVRGDLGDLAVFDGNVADAVKALGRVDDGAAFYNQVIHGEMGLLNTLEIT